MKILKSMACVVAAVVSVSAFGTYAGEAVSLKVTGRVVHQIDPRMFGQFMERPSWGEIGVEGALKPGTNQLQDHARRLLEEMRIPVIRFPGGTDVDFMDWRDMVSNVLGRSAERPVSVGHTGQKVTNHFGYDEFLQFCEKTGAEAIVVVNFRDGLLRKKPLAEAASHAASLAAYCAAPVGAGPADSMYDWPALRAKNGRREPYRVRYFQIGNETWAFVNELKRIAGDDYVQWYVDCVKAYIDAIEAVAPDAEFIVDGHDGSMSGIVPVVFEQLGGRIDYFAAHFYRPWALTGVSRDGSQVSLDTLKPQDIWYAWVAITQFDRAGLSVYNPGGLQAARRRGYRVAMTEWNWNGWWRVGDATAPLNSVWAKGIGAAGFLHAMMRSGDVIDIGCQSMLVGMGWPITAVHTDPAGRLDARYMPSGQITAFYSKNHGDRLLAVETEGVPTYSQPYRMGGIGPKEKIAVVDALATADERAVYIHAINRSFADDIDLVIDISALKADDGMATVRLIKGRLNDEPGPDQPLQVAYESASDVPVSGSKIEVTLPKRSVSIVEASLSR